MKSPSKNPASGRHNGSTKLKTNPEKTSIKNVKPIKGTRAMDVMAKIGPKRKK